jgi:hypothetical protein
MDELAQAAGWTNFTVQMFFAERIERLPHETVATLHTA